MLLPVTVTILPKPAFLSAKVPMAAPPMVTSSVPSFVIVAVPPSVAFVLAL